MISIDKDKRKNEAPIITNSYKKKQTIVTIIMASSLLTYEKHNWRVSKAMFLRETLREIKYALFLVDEEEVPGEDFN